MLRQNWERLISIQMLRYLDSEAALATLESGRLWVSKAGTFNDPYEFSMIMKGQDGDGYHDHFVRKIIDLNVRVLSVSIPESLTGRGDILMWSHYAKSHSGFRLHLSPEFLAEKSIVDWEIEYEKKIPSVNMDIYGPDQEMEAFYAISQGLRAKADFWSYENEKRYFYEKSALNYSRKSKVHYLSLPASSITRIDIGIATPAHAVERLFGLVDKRKWSRVEVFQARQTFGEFRITYKKEE